MKNTIKDIFLMGVGAASLTRKKAEKTIKGLVKNDVINNKQAKEAVDIVMREADKIKSILEQEGRKETAGLKKKAIRKSRSTKKKIGKAASKAVRRLTK
jgi:polyhydroxyalkanoate synthesis regulator phasin